jgi:DNA-binding NarL/FixJ family response regulator
MIRILIADPDPATRKALILLLQHKLGTDCIFEVRDVEALIRNLSDIPPDLLLLDWRLYGSPAPETCRLLRKAFPEMNIILLSVNAEDATAAKEAGASFIHKGAPPDELIATLTPLLRKNINPE